MKNAPPTDVPLTTLHPSLREAFFFWLKLGFISFGGPAGQIAIMQTELVDRRRWISQSRFLHALNYCMLLPGPEAQQLAIYIGWLLHKTIGGIVAGALFIIPSIFVLWLLSYVYAAFGNLPWIAAIFYGLKPAVTAIVVAALVRIGRNALKTPTMWGLAFFAFVAIYFFRIPFPLIIVAAGLCGFIGDALGKNQFAAASTHAAEASALGDTDQPSAHTDPSWSRAVRVSITCLALWITPTLIAGIAQGRESTLFREGLFFSKAAVVTFGGAYAVLPYVAQQAMFHYGWLKPGQMMDGLGLAETTPGPLIMVVQFVGFMGAWQHPEGLPPVLAATLTSALSAITAAVVGVVLNLAVWFSGRVFFPERGGVDWFAVSVTLAALVGLLRWKWNVVAVVIGAGAVGLCWRYLILGG